MADIRIKDLATTATTSASDDYLALDGSTNGTRKILATNVANNVTDVVFGASGPSAKSSIAARAARQGLVFDGTAKIPFSLAAFGTNPATIHFWFNPATFTANPRLLGASSAIQLLLDGTGVQFFTSGGSVYSAALTVGKMAAVTVVINGNGTALIYTNGIAGTSGSITANLSTAIDTIGGLSTGNVFSGVLSPLIYNRALSAAEVVSLYEAGVPAGADYNTASNTNISVDTFVNGTGAATFTGASATAFTISGTTGGAAGTAGRAVYGTDLGASLRIGTKYRVTFSATITSAEAPVVAIGHSGTGYASNQVTVTNGTNTIELTIDTTRASNRLLFVSTASTAINYAVSSLVWTRLGLLLAPDAAQSGGGLTWYDTSGNAANITLPATGVTWNVPSSRYLGGNWTNTGTFTVKGPDNGSLYVDTSSATNYTSLYFRNNGGSNAAGLYHYTGDGSLTINSFGGNLIFARTTGEAARIVNSTGRFLLGTTTDSGALLQVGTNTTTSAGGIVFGTDVSLYRYQAGGLSISSTSGAPALTWAESGINRTFTYFSAGHYLGTYGAHPLIFQTNTTTALTISSTQAATFAGTATLYTIGASSTGENSLIFTGADGNGNVRTPAKITGKQAGNGGYGSLVFQTAFNNSLVDALTINSSQAATFAGAVTVGGALKLANAYVAGAVVGTGYVTIQDSTGTTYRVPVLV